LSLLALALVSLAAVLHTGWNALSKRSPDPVGFLWGAVSVSALAFAPVVVWTLLHTPPVTGLLLATLSGLIHAVYFWSLGRAYARGDLSTVYPIARGLGVALVAPLSVVLLGETPPSAQGGVGLALVVAGVVLSGGRPAAMRGGVGWAALTGLCIAAYYLVDRAGIEHLPPLAFVGLQSAVAAVGLWPVGRRHWGAARPATRRGFVLFVAAGLATFLGYVLVLLAFQLARTGYVVAARELSIVLSTLVGTLLFREGRAVERLAPALLILVGVVSIVLAR
jgi:drug/metabolite transporter (DMT)-like permease